ncbi:MAG: heavy-metal-associated domain-containing protein [Desulfuromonadaceae bacterium]|nr:heavy-metal-associated domain-containing protein [Desulfuromonadaceae bacterium]
MKRKRMLVNAVIIVVTITILSLLGFYVTARATADSVAVLRTTGMTCGSCSSKITKALESLKGVAVTEVDVEGGWVVVGYDTKSVKPEALAAQVISSGFGSNVYKVLTPEQFKQATGRDIGAKAIPSSGCCGGKGGGCGSTNKKS